MKPSISSLRSGGFSIGHKILAVVGLCVFFTVVVAAASIYQMNKIGQEIEAIAENDMPLSEVVSRITAHQLEQSILLERMLRMSGLVGAATGEEIRAVEAAFEALSHEVNEEIKEGEVLAEEALSHARNQLEKDEYQKVLGALQRIEVEHKSFEKHAIEIFELTNRGQVDGAIALIHGLEEEEAKLNHELETLLNEIERFTLLAARTAEEHEKMAIKQLIVISIVSALLGFGLSVWFSRKSVSRPLSQVVTALDRLAEGDTSVSIDVRSKDEIGQVARAFETFKAKTIELKRLEEQRLQEQARVEEEKRQATHTMADRLEENVMGVVNTVSGAVTEMEGTAQAMSESSTMTSQQASNVAAAAEQASSNVQTVASAAEELVASIQEISRQLSAATEAATTASNQATQTSQTVSGLSDSAQEIGNVVGLINDIAEQTNLLALNATIEAARAGDAGKGFAVVASEVKSLATQTAKATEEIRQQISNMQSVSAATAGEIGTVVAAIQTITEQVSGIASAVEEQNAVTSEIARNTQEAAQGSQHITSNITGVSSAAAESSQAAGQVMTTVTMLSEQSAMLQSELEKFLRGIRAA